jgi:hypothetical protein
MAHSPIRSCHSVARLLRNVNGRLSGDAAYQIRRCQHLIWIKGDGLFFPAGASYPMLIDPQRSRRCMEDLLFVSDIE